MTSLENRQCVPCEGGVEPLVGEKLEELAAMVSPEWQFNPDKTAISREFQFRNYYQTTAFVNAVAWIAHREDHHPDISFGYKNCNILYTTHAIDGLSENDFICAAKIDALLATPDNG